MSNTARYDTFLSNWAKDSYPPSPQALSAWSKLLKDPSVPASDVAKEIIIPLVQQHEKAPDPLGPDCIRIWQLLVDSVETLTELNDRFVDFTVALQQRPECDGGFHSLPHLAEHMTEFSFGYVDRGDRRQSFANINAFAAKLCAQGLPSSNEVKRGGIVLRTALEKPWAPSEIRSLDGWIPATEQWIKHCGYEIYSQKGHMGREWPSKWKGEPGWSKERWAFWKRRFRWAATLSPLKKTTREIAEACSKEMDAIDGEK